MSAAAGIGQGALLSRGLGVDAFGAFTWMSSLGVLAQLAADLGLSTVLVRDLAAGRAGGDHLRAAWVLRTVGAVLSGLAVALVLVLSRPTTTAERLGITLVCLTPLVTAAAGIPRSALRADGRMAWVALVTAGEAAARLAATALALGLGGALPAVAAVCLAVPVLGAAAAWVPVAWTRREWCTATAAWPTAVGPLVRDAWPFALTAWVGVANMRLDMAWAGRWLDARELGHFGAGSRVLDGARMGAIAVYGALLPALSARRERSRAVHPLEALVLVACAAAVLVLVVLAAPVLTALYGAPFAEAAPAFRWQVAASLPFLVGTLLSIRLTVEHRQAGMLTADVVALALGAAMQTALAPTFGAPGAAGAGFARECLTALGYGAALAAGRVAAGVRTSDR